jgi:hypothetical protein
MNSELPHLRELDKVAPRSAMGRVTAAWTLIRSHLDSGKRPHEVYQALVDDGLDLTYAQFRVYVHRLRKRDLGGKLPSRSSGGPTHPVPTRHVAGGQPHDPLRNLREQRAKTKSFDYDPFPRKGLTQ